VLPRAAGPAAQDRRLVPLEFNRHDDDADGRRFPPSGGGAKPRPVTFDLDKTLFDEVTPHRFASADAVAKGTVPHKQACDRVRELLDAGVPVAFVTRRAAATMRAVTMAQLRAWISVDVQDNQVHMPHEWRGYQAGLTWSIATLQTLDSQAHVGDHEVLDRQAAQLAGVPFLHANDWRRGDPLPCYSLEGAHAQ
jgi:hypothetical protein